MDPLFSSVDVERLLQERAAELASDWGHPASGRRPGSGRPRRIPSKFQTNKLVRGNALDVARSMPDGVVQAIVTSPPFYGQRIYEDETPVKWQDGARVAFGRESSPEAYVAHTLDVFAELGRVLKPNGTIWWNIGDSYQTDTIARTSSADRLAHYGGKRTKWSEAPGRRYSSGHPYLKDKDLTLVPFRIAVGAQRLGYWLRSIIVWSKQFPLENPGVIDEIRRHVPEVVADRPVTGHEYVLLFSKNAKYDYYATNVVLNGQTPGPAESTALNVRTVWNFPPAENAGHAARFPDELPKRCILLSSKRGDLIFDPFAGEGTTLRVARDLGRTYFGSDVSKTYIAWARARLRVKK